MAVALVDRLPTASETILPLDALHSEGSFVNARQYKIFTQRWIPVDGPLVATLVLVHGLGEHSNRYGSFVQHLIEQNIAVFALDHEAHGKSEGRPEYVEKVQHLVDDVVTYATAVHQEFPGLPRVIFGHSMGGCVSMTVCLQQPSLFDLSIFAAPATSRPVTVNPVVRAFGGLVAKVSPRSRLTPLERATLCRDPDFVQSYKEDPLIWHRDIPVGFGLSILDTGDKVIDDRAKFTLPVLLLSGTGDQMVNPSGSLKFFNGCSSTDKTYLSLTGWYHELLHEPEGAQLEPIISSWIKERLGTTVASDLYKIGTVDQNAKVQFQVAQAPK